MAIDHVNIPVTDTAASEAFYTAALAPLDMAVIARDADAVGYGQGDWTFGIVPAAQIIDPLHLGFAAQNRAAVDAFYRAGLAAGGTDNGAPGLRPAYGATYYAAYLHDPDGHNIEAVCRIPQA